MRRNKLSAAAQHETMVQRETAAAYSLAHCLAETAQLAVETGDDPATALRLAGEAFTFADDLADFHAQAAKETETAAAEATETLLRDLQRGGE